MAQPVAIGVLLSGRGDEGEAGVVGAVAGGVAGEEAVAGDGGVGADEEIGQGGGAGAATATISEEGFAGQESGAVGDGFPVDDAAGEGGFEVFDAGEVDGDFGVDDGVDDEAGAVGGGGEGGCRPVGPLGVLGHHVEQDVAVNEDGGHSLAPGEGHDLVGGHGALATAAQMGDEAGATARLAGGGDGDDADGGAVVFEGDLGVGHEAGAGADIGGDGDLALGGDAHGVAPDFLLLTVRNPEALCKSGRHGATVVHRYCLFGSNVADSAASFAHIDVNPSDSMSTQKVKAIC